MRLMIIRHAEPDYERDTLTEKGWREARLLSERMASLKHYLDGEIYCYCSPLGRARDTASLSLEVMGKDAVTIPWLQEFRGTVPDPETGRMRICWDILPEKWTGEEISYDRNRWMEYPAYQGENVAAEAAVVRDGIDRLLAGHGYVREREIYHAVKPNRDIVVLFCHLGVEAVMLSRILGISAMLFWHGFCSLPSSVTTLYTEERQEGKAFFRVSSFGDLSHLYAGGEEPSFAARFCETYDCMEERH